MREDDIFMEEQRSWYYIFKEVVPGMIPTTNKPINIELWLTLQQLL